MMFLTAAQNRCIKSMPKMAHAPDKVRTPKEQFLELVLIQGYSIRLVSAAIIAPPLAVATLIFGSDS